MTPSVEPDPIPDLDDYDYQLPSGHIAQEGLPERDAAKLMMTE